MFEICKHKEVCVREEFCHYSKAVKRVVDVIVGMAPPVDGALEIDALLTEALSPEYEGSELSEMIVHITKLSANVARTRLRQMVNGPSPSKRVH